MAKVKPAASKLARTRRLSASTRESEVSAALQSQIGRCAARANDQAERLQCIGDQAFAEVGEIFRDADPKQLLQRSNAIRGLVGHALSVLAELLCEAGRLDAFAALREAESVGEPR
jgi:hypothetical protein